MSLQSSRMRSEVTQLWCEYEEMRRTLNHIYDEIQTRCTLLERVRLKIKWVEVRDICIVRLNEKISLLLDEIEAQKQQEQLMDLTRAMITCGFVRETSLSEKGEHSLFASTCIDSHTTTPHPPTYPAASTSQGMTGPNPRARPPRPRPTALDPDPAAAPDRPTPPPRPTARPHPHTRPPRPGRPRAYPAGHVWHTPPPHTVRFAPGF